ncbi:N-acetyltransferase [Erythrobacter sp. WH131]|uniref:N-acetyltransferase n=1 Tax=Erythrobacter ani TaxID=2827235 RepID=A0ABS6SPG7_9SPHN|nr:N-acetyltransferase [Erythrobacter ani]
MRPAQTSDAHAIQAIYAHHVAHGTGTFDTEAPDAEFWRCKLAHFERKGWPFLVAQIEDEVIAYAYAAQFRERAAYAQTCEDSIYVAPDACGGGAGTMLLGHLIEAARSAGFKQMIAVVGGGEPASIALHTKLGFEHAGRLRQVGSKFGRKLDTVYMQRDLTRKDAQ